MKITDRKTEIINVAAKLFKEKGYSAVTVRDIAHAMDIKAASLYNHIKSKQEILVLIVIEIAEEFTNIMDEVLNSDAPTIDKLERIIQLHIDITLRNPDALACLNNDWMHLTDTKLDHFIKMRKDYENNFKIIVKTGIENGEIKNYNIDDIICIDEISINSLQLRHYCYNEVGKRCIVKTNSQEVFKKYTGIFAISINGVEGYELYNKGGIDGDRLLAFLERFINKYKNKVIILDNASSHRNIRVKELINKNNKLIYSVPYQHYTNSIEMFFSLLKSKLQKKQGLYYEDLNNNIKEVIKTIPEDYYKRILNGTYNRQTKYINKY